MTTPPSDSTGPNTNQPEATQAAPPAPKFDPSAPHQQRPRLRPVRGFPAQAKGPDGREYQMLGLADARQISDRIVITVPAAAHILPLLDGSRDLDAVVSQVGRGLNRQILEQLVAQLDDAGLLEGPAFQAVYEKFCTAFDSKPVLPPGSTAQFADMLLEAAGVKGLPDAERDERAPAEIRKAFDRWIDEALKDAPDPAFNALPRAVVAPHLDYPRGWMNYAAVYGRLRTVDRPDRIVVLGTNHFGASTGVCGSDKGYSTPLGACELDGTLVEALRSRLGPEDTERLFKHRFDHEREHSIELQIAWSQHVFGRDTQGRYPAVFAALIHDPCIKNGESYDGRGVALTPFIDALREVLAALPGRTLVIASADLSHVGPAFGDREPMAGDDEQAEQRRRRVFERDREMIGLLTAGKAQDLVSAMAWEQNPTRWCSIGNLIAAVMLTQPSSVRLLNYAAAMDEQGMAMVSSAAMVME